MAQINANDIPAGTTLEGYWHTHPGGVPNTDPENFSQFVPVVVNNQVVQIVGDYATAYGFQFAGGMQAAPAYLWHPIFVGTPSGAVKVFDPWCNSAQNCVGGNPVTTLVPGRP